MLPKPEKLEDSILVTHRGCLDGAGCVILFLACGGKEENVRYVVAGQLERFVKEDPLWDSDRFLLVADLGLNTARYDDLLEKRGNLVVLDHHKTSLHMLGRPWAEIERENGRCGSVMLHDYLTENFWDRARHVNTTSWQIFVKAIDAHDRWKKERAETFKLGGNLATLMTFFGQAEFVRRFRDPKQKVCDSISRWGEKKFLDEFEAELLPILEARREEGIAEAIKRAFVRELVLPDGSRVQVAYAVSSDPNISLLLERLGEKFPDAQVACQVNVDRGIASLRSDGRYDSTVVAQAFGGGGHRAASGHRLPDDLREIVVEHVHG